MIGPSPGQLDPVKDITAEILAVGEGFSTREQSTIRLNGGQWDANVDQLARENAKLAEANAPLQVSSSSGTGGASGATEPGVVAALRNEIIKALKEDEHHESK